MVEAATSRWMAWRSGPSFSIRRRRQILLRAGEWCAWASAAASRTPGRTTRRNAGTGSCNAGRYERNQLGRPSSTLRPASIGARLFVVDDCSTLLGRVGVGHLGIGARADGVVGRGGGRPTLIEEVGLRHFGVVGSREVVLVIDERLRLLQPISLGLRLVRHGSSLKDDWVARSLPL